MTLFRVEMRRLWSRRAIVVLHVLFLVLIVVIIGANYFHASNANPLTASFVHDSGVGTGAGYATVAFVLGASAGGAEWAARTMEALLVWEPRRVRLLVTKAAALAASIAAAAIVVQIVVGVLSRLAVAGEGSMADASEHFWSTYVGYSATSVAYAVITALLAFAIASLTRNTGFALGAAFVYFLFIEHLLMLLPDWVDRLTFVNNAGAFIDHGGDTGDVQLSTLHGGVTLVVYVAVVLGAAIALFNRRDVT
jgi:ABC-type transport system involved in multi-copper enzyme maturation permease subunit